jgi:hypothetical protein
MIDHVMGGDHNPKVKIGPHDGRPALFQLFFYDPNGIKIELNYAAGEAEGVEPELMASELITQR